MKNVEAMAQKKMSTRKRIRNCVMKRHDHHMVFPEDVLFNVLSKLPVKTLMKFRANPFRKGPFSFSLESMDRERNPISRFNFKLKRWFAQVLPTRFDLVCIVDDGIVNICNPSTHEIVTLPEDPKLPFYPPLTYVGFGYVESRDEYKVVRFIPPNDGRVYYGRDEDVEPGAFIPKCQVFNLGGTRKNSSSGSSSWAWRSVVVPPYKVVYANEPAFVNGAIHWLVLYELWEDVAYRDNVIDPVNKILVFDVEREEFSLIPCPEDGPDLKSPDVQHINHLVQLVELRGLLCLSSCVEGLGSKMDIWMLKGYRDIGSGSSSGTWVKEYSIDLNVLHRGYRLSEIDLLSGLVYAPRDIDDTKILIETTSRGLGYYHLQTASFEGLILHSRPSKLRLCFTFFVESLRSPTQFPPPLNF